MRNAIGEFLGEFLGEFVVGAAICLIGGVFVLGWAKHPILMIAGVVAIAFVAGWFGYLWDPQLTRKRRIRTALTAGVLGGLGAFAVSLVFCSCT